MPALLKPRPKEFAKWLFINNATGVAAIQLINFFFPEALETFQPYQLTMLINSFPIILALVKSTITSNLGASEDTKAVDQRKTVEYGVASLAMHATSTAAALSGNSFLTQCYNNGPNVFVSGILGKVSGKLASCCFWQSSPETLEADLEAAANYHINDSSSNDEALLVNNMS